jgi:hypothetical protein
MLPLRSHRLSYPFLVFSYSSDRSGTGALVSSYVLRQQSSSFLCDLIIVHNVSPAWVRSVDRRCHTDEFVHHHCSIEVGVLTDATGTKPLMEHRYYCRFWLMGAVGATDHLMLTAVVSPPGA